MNNKVLLAIWVRDGADFLDDRRNFLPNRTGGINQFISYLVVVICEFKALRHAIEPSLLSLGLSTPQSFRAGRSPVYNPVPSEYTKSSDIRHKSLSKERHLHWTKHVLLIA
jgi:hypothetical protein